MQLLTAAIGATLLVLTGLLVLAGLLFALVWVVRQLLRLVVIVLAEAGTSAAEAEGEAARTAPGNQPGTTLDRHA
jgi:hypothetical protein